MSTPDSTGATIDAIDVSDCVMPEHDALLVAVGVLRDEARQRRAQHAVAERREHRRRRAATDDVREAEPEVADDERGIPRPPAAPHRNASRAVR